MPTLAPKVHPLARLAEADDPMELMADTVPGDPDFMLECLISEFAWSGHSAHEVLQLFDNPGYPVLGQLREFHGDAVIRDRVRSLFDNLRAVRVTAVVDENADDDHEDDGPELIQLSVRRRGGK